MILTAFNGMCMAIADSVPGVSGGTIAFILGFYDRFIDALHSLFGKEKQARKQAVVYLLKLGVGWCLGMCACVLLLSSLFAKNIYFMSSVFLGLTCASIPFVILAERDVLRGGPKNIPFAVLGAAVVIGITLLLSGSDMFGTIDFLKLQPLHFFYLLLAGMVAIAAMVLPGISGSTVLLISGVYLPAINAVKQLLSFNLAHLPGLIALGLGVILGIALSIRFIRSALRRHRSKMVYLIIGLMAGSLFAIVMGPTTLSQPVPALSASTFSIAGFLIGIAILFALELLRKAVSGKKRTSAATVGGAVKNEH